MKGNTLRFLFLSYACIIGSIYSVIFNIKTEFRVPLRYLLLCLYKKRVFIDNDVCFRYPSTVYLRKYVSINRACEFYSFWFDRKVTKIVNDNNVRLGSGGRFLTPGMT